AVGCVVVTAPAAAAAVLHSSQFPRAAILIDHPVRLGVVSLVPANSLHTAPIGIIDASFSRAVAEHPQPLPNLIAMHGVLAAVGSTQPGSTIRQRLSFHLKPPQIKASDATVVQLRMGDAFAIAKVGGASVRSVGEGYLVSVGGGFGEAAPRIIGKVV